MNPVIKGRQTRFQIFVNIVIECERKIVVEISPVEFSQVTEHGFRVLCPEYNDPRSCK